MPEYAIGEGQHRGRGPVIESYADTQALEVLCPACHAKPGDFCTHEAGVARRIPCPRRITAARTKAQEDK